MQTLLSKIVLTVFVDAISVIAAGYILYTQSLNMFIGIIVNLFAVYSGRMDI